MKRIVIILILLIATFLRFYNLLHDSPYFFNPDERNMANAITQFRLPTNVSEIPRCLISQFSKLQATNYNLQPDSCNLNPHFFAYGQFPLYLAFFSDQLSHLLTTHYLLPTSFTSAIFWLRFYSALSSTFTVLLVYLITKELFKNLKVLDFIGNWKLEIGNYAAILAAFTPGLIQSAHFGTTESLLTFFFLASVYLSIKFLNQPINISLKKFIILNSVVLGLSLGTKLTGIFFFIPLLISIIIRFITFFKKSRNNRSQIIVTLKHCVIVTLLIIGSLGIYFLSSPYNFLEYDEFKSSVFGYESDVATGKYEAFYTRQFVNTLPLQFQTEKIFPYALGWPIFTLGVMGFFLMVIILLKWSLSKYRIKMFQFTNGTIRQKNNCYIVALCIVSFLFYLVPNAFLFTKWTRFMTPIFPFFSIFAAYFVFHMYKHITIISSKYQRLNLLFVVLTFAFCILSLLPGAAYMSIYTHPDTRIQASEWIYQNIPDDSYILSETGNVIDIPLHIPSYNLQPETFNLNVISFDFYHLDENPLLFEELINHLEKSDYIFIPSRRIFANYSRLPEQFPLVTKYYQLLLSGALGFEEVTRINSFPRLSIINYQLSIPDEEAEETFTVFDHPVIRIYKKVYPMVTSEYMNLFK